MEFYNGKNISLVLLTNTTCSIRKTLLIQMLHFWFDWPQLVATLSETQQSDLFLITAIKDHQVAPRTMSGVKVLPDWLRLKVSYFKSKEAQTKAHGLTSPLRLKF